MKHIIRALAILLFAPALAIAQSAPNASTLAAPQPLPSATASPVAAVLMASTATQSWTPGPLNVSVGAVVSFMLLPCGTPYPATLVVKVNGKDLSFSSGAALSFTADTAGVWNVALDMNGFFSNIVTVTAR